MGNDGTSGSTAMGQGDTGIQSSILKYLMKKITLMTRYARPAEDG